MKKNKALGVIAIIGACILVVGIVCSVIGVATGGWRSYVSALRTEGSNLLDLPVIEEYNGGGNSNGSTQVINKDDRLVGDLNSIELEVPYGEIDIVVGSYNGYKISEYTTKQLDISFSGGKLSIIDRSSWRNSWQFPVNRLNPKIIITVTAETLEQLKISTGAGDVEVEGFSIKDLWIETGAGSISFEDVKAEKATLTTGAGEVDFENCDLKDMRVETGAGSFTYTGALRGNCSIMTGAGEIVLRLTGAESNYYVVVGAGIGSVQFNSNNSSGLIGERSYGSSSAPCKIRIESGVGSVDIRTN